MTTYVALLRGINIGGRAKIGMAELRQAFAALGHGEVTSYLQSGNVVFSTSGTGPSRLARAIEQRIAEDLGVATTVLLRAPGELAQVVAANPFLATADGSAADPAALHVTFLADVPERERAALLEAPPGIPDRLSLAGREVYLHCPGGYGRTKLNNAFIERRLGVAATTRNWRTVTKLRDLAGG